MYHENTATFSMPTTEEVCEELGLTPGEFAAMDGATKYDAFLAFAYRDADLTFAIEDDE